MNNIYEKLEKSKLVESQYDFSEKWLNKGKTYYGTMKALERDISAQAKLNLFKNINKKILLVDTSEKLLLSEIQAVLLENIYN